MCEYCSTRTGRECDVCLGVIICNLHMPVHDQSQEHKYSLQRNMKMQPVSEATPEIALSNKNS
jgi:hypothetical protein